MSVRDLTPRERQIYDAVMTGAQHKVIAKALGISHTTVKTHVCNMRRRGIQIPMRSYSGKGS